MSASLRERLKRSSRYYHSPLAPKRLCRQSPSQPQQSTPSRGHASQHSDGDVSSTVTSMPPERNSDITVDSDGFATNAPATTQKERCSDTSLLLPVIASASHNVVGDSRVSAEGITNDCTDAAQLVPSNQSQSGAESSTVQLSTPTDTPRRRKLGDDGAAVQLDVPTVTPHRRQLSDDGSTVQFSTPTVTPHRHRVGDDGSTVQFSTPTVTPHRRRLGDNGSTVQLDMPTVTPHRHRLGENNDCATLVRHSMASPAVTRSESSSPAVTCSKSSLSVLDDLNELTRRKTKLEESVKRKEETLRKLKMVELYRTKVSYRNNYKIILKD